ncbi:MAG: hypothetical protein OXE87_15365 [Chloroflexi bacterium]|nr:hypothetical protein [Chloroflexota bacterium]
MTRSAHFAGPAGWVLLLVMSVSASLLACAEPSAITVADLITRDPEEHQRILRDGIADGRLLWVKTEQNQSEPSGNLPGRFETEMWLGATADGTITTAVSTLHYPDGPETMDMTATYAHITLTAWLDQAWNLTAFAERAGAVYRGPGRLHGWDSLIYEWDHDTEIQRLEIVADAPLIARESSYQVTQQGVLELRTSNSVIEYRLLPPGAEPPAVDRQ